MHILDAPDSTRPQGLTQGSLTRSGQRMCEKKLDFFKVI